ncbi:hypothetical protein ACEQPO_07490 [Bacillus sp. SL00103]
MITQDRGELTKQKPPKGLKEHQGDCMEQKMSAKGDKIEKEVGLFLGVVIPRPLIAFDVLLLLVLSLTEWWIALFAGFSVFLFFVIYSFNQMSPMKQSY